MPRGPRDDAPGAAHHIMVRGIGRSAIFRDDADRRELLRRFSLLFLELGFRCFAFALIPNHFHLLVQSGEVKVSRLMARLGTGYARYFNQRHDRVGHLFQNRFRSRRVVDDADLMGLVRYVCLNPLEAGLVADAKTLEEFSWCSAGALLGRRPAEPFESVAETLALFDVDVARAQARLRSWLEAPARTSGQPAPALPPAARCSASSWDSSIATLVREVCLLHGVSEAELASPRRCARIAGARSAFVIRAASELALSGSEMARACGVTPSGISRMLERARREGQTSQLVKERPRFGSRGC